jgi:hypothetical protein
VLAFEVPSSLFGPETASGEEVSLLFVGKHYCSVAAEDHLFFPELPYLWI